eukprot:scaffold275939_cov21-Tisochrysis_lutea.AAC.1
MAAQAAATQTQGAALAAAKAAMEAEYKALMDEAVASAVANARDTSEREHQERAALQTEMFTSERGDLLATIQRLETQVASLSEALQEGGSASAAQLDVAAARATEEARAEATAILADREAEFARLLQAKQAELAARESEFSRDQDEMFGTISKLEEELEKLRASSSAPAAADISSSASDDVLVELQSQLVAAISDRETSAAELMRCQEELAVCKAELLDLRLSLEESSSRLVTSDKSAETVPPGPSNSAADAVKRTLSNFKPFVKKPPK